MMIMTSAPIGKADRNMPDHLASAVMALTRRNSLKRARITWARPCKISARLPPELLLNGHGHGQKAQILIVHAFGKFFQAFGDIATIGGFVADDAKFGAQRVGDFTRRRWRSAD